MTPTTLPPTAAALFPPAAVVKARLIQACDEVRILRKLLALSETAERAAIQIHPAQPTPRSATHEGRKTISGYTGLLRVKAGYRF